MKNKQYYCLVYYHCLSETKEGYRCLEKIYKKLPKMYIETLDNMFIIEPTFAMKSLGKFNFKQWDRFISEYRVNVDSFE